MLRAIASVQLEVCPPGLGWDQGWAGAGCPWPPSASGRSSCLGDLRVCFPQCTPTPSSHSGGNHGMRNWTLRWVLVYPVPITRPRPSSRWGGAGERDRPPFPASGAQSPGACPGGGRAVPFLAQGLLPPLPLQKIMHTRKRHQDMFQDLNRKLQHAEKDKDVLGPDSKVWRARAGAGLRGAEPRVGRGVGRAWTGL